MRLHGRHIAASGGLALAGLLVSASRAQAHMVAPDVGDFYAGMLHPLTSVEHAVTLVALALFASQCGKAAARWAIVLFPPVLALGLWGGSVLPGPGVAFVADVVWLCLLGVLVMAATRLAHPTGVAALAAVVTGLVLGWRGGGDWAASTVGWRFVPGVAATGFVVVAVVAAWVPRLDGRGAGWLRLALGAALVCSGALMGLGQLGGGPVAAGLPALPTTDELAALARSPIGHPGLVVAAVLGAMVWGAGHALTPGHGKALVGAYLVGSRGTFAQAVALGCMVTITHTLGVFLLGGIAYFAAGSLESARLFPWLTLASGLGVAAVGLALAVSRLRQLREAAHSHAHTHGGPVHSHGGLTHSHGGIPHSHGGLPPGERKLGWRSLVALGVSGGLVPCPGALVLLLGAMAVGRVGFGLALVAAFSLGLAGVLTVVGLLFIKGARLLEKVPSFGTATRYLPLASALVVTVLGLALSWEAALGLFGS